MTDICQKLDKQLYFYSIVGSNLLHDLNNVSLNIKAFFVLKEIGIIPEKHNADSTAASCSAP